MEKRESYECQVSRDILSNSGQVIAIQINVDPRGGHSIVK